MQQGTLYVSTSFKQPPVNNETECPVYKPPTPPDEPYHGQRQGPPPLIPLSAPPPSPPAPPIPAHHSRLYQLSTQYTLISSILSNLTTEELDSLSRVARIFGQVLGPKSYRFLCTNVCRVCHHEMPLKAYLGMKAEGREPLCLSG